MFLEVYQPFAGWKKAFKFQPANALRIYNKQTIFRLCLGRIIMKKLYLFLAIITLSFTVNAQLKSNDFLLEGRSNFSNEKKSANSENKGSTETPDFVKLNEAGVKKALVEKNYPEAIVLFNQAIEANPNCFVCRYNIGRSQVKIGKLNEAAEIFRKLIEQWPDFANAHSSLGETLSEKGLFRESLASYEKALSLSPDDCTTLTNYALSLQNVGEYKKALEYLDKALKIDPDLAEAHSNRGLTLFVMGRQKDALVSMKKAFQLRPEVPEIRNNLGVILDHFGKKKEALKHFEEAVRLKPDYAEAQYNLALCYLERGDRDAAYRQMKTLEESNFELAQQLKGAIWGKYVVNAPSPNND